MADRAAYAAILEDLAAEHRDLDALVASLDDTAWDVPTPAAGWAVRDQIGHLAYYDVRAREALTEPEAFAAGVAEMLADPTRAAGIDAEHLAEARSLTPGKLLEAWRIDRAALLETLATTDPGVRVPWYGPPMSVPSFATARLMETWAHGQDVADALGVTRLPTARLRHVAHIGVRAMPFSFRLRGLDVPEAPVRVELRSPDHELWTWGPEDASDRISGSALDFGLVVTQRRHPDDAHLEIVGPVAQQWIEIAQAFAGPPGNGRRAGQFRAE